MLFQMQIKVKQSDVNRANIFCQKKIKAEESMTFQNIFSSMADFRDVVSVLLAARQTGPTKRVSMGLTDWRNTAKNLVESRKNWKILTVNRK